MRFKVINKIETETETETKTIECGDMASVEFTNGDVLTCRIERITPDIIDVTPEMMVGCMLRLNLCDITGIY